MREIDKGHRFILNSYDGPYGCELQFMKREGKGYPGNEGHYPGTNCQEVMRALITRIIYLNWQESCLTNKISIWLLRVIIWLFEYRAARRHNVYPVWKLHNIEKLATCPTCGHIKCNHGTLSCTSH